MERPQENSEEKLLSTSILGIPVSALKISVEIVTLLWIVAEDVLRGCCLRPIVVISVTQTVSLREFEDASSGMDVTERKSKSTFVDTPK